MMELWNGMETFTFCSRSYTVSSLKGDREQPGASDCGGLLLQLNIDLGTWSSKGSTGMIGACCRREALS